ncbi:MAG: hypothetical protein OEW04_06710, partial [Nitrospirota bacterium]|nr:hypothetical protein [Nitrospirota bacterium]
DRKVPADGTLTALPDISQVTLSWTGFADTGSGIDRYKVVYSTGGMPASCSTGTLIYEGTAATYTHAGLADGTTCYYRTCAIDGAGNVSAGATASATVPAAPEGSIPAGVQLACPVSVQQGTALTVTVYLYNQDCYSSVSVDRFMASVMGNTDGTLSGLGLFGPANKAYSVTKVVPPATCDAYGTVITPGTVAAFTMTVNSAVPSSLSGKMATVDIEAVTDTGQTFGGGECMVNVVQ